MLKKNTYILLAVLFSLLFSFESKGQCVEGDVIIPNCIQQGISTTFYNNTDETAVLSSGPNNNSCTIEYEWVVYDYWTGVSWGPFFTNDLMFTFPDTGTYEITLDIDIIGGSNNSCCPGGGGQASAIENDYESFYIFIPYDTLEIQLNATTEICEGETIDINSIGLGYSGNYGNVTYNGISTPSGLNWLTSLPPTETGVIVTITDDSTGCTDQDSIAISFLPPAINPNITASATTIYCADDSINFTASPYDPLLTYSWSINNTFINNGESINPNFNWYVNNGYNNVDVNLEVSNSTGVGCPGFASETIAISSTAPFVLDDSNYNYDPILDAYTFCNQVDSSSSQIWVNTNDTAGVDSIIVSWGNGITQVITEDDSISNFHTIIGNISTSLTNLTFTTYSSN
ncbi:MAG: hypothetical protein O2781_01020, partial [Bacteroidetes bacterium]|nr:hypothetical protein [Bacteroidota bacterium]